jgi:hypothetical protein
MSDYQPKIHESQNCDAEILCFPAERVVRWPEQKLPMVVVLPDWRPPFFQVIDIRT